jgi:hypothetical protein
MTQTLKEASVIGTTEAGHVRCDDGNDWHIL